MDSPTSGSSWSLRWRVWRSPVLARWQYGLGKVVEFTSDVKNRWAVNWLDWPGYGKLWAQLARETMRSDSGEELDFRV